MDYWTQATHVLLPWAVSRTRQITIDAVHLYFSHFFKVLHLYFLGFCLSGDGSLVRFFWASSFPFPMCATKMFLLFYPWNERIPRLRVQIHLAEGGAQGDTNPRWQSIFHSSWSFYVKILVEVSFNRWCSKRQQTIVFGDRRQLIASLLFSSCVILYILAINSAPQETSHASTQAEINSFRERFWW